jgi:hypothetical protein
LHLLSLDACAVQKLTPIVVNTNNQIPPYRDSINGTSVRNRHSAGTHATSAAANVRKIVAIARSDKVVCT